MERQSDLAARCALVVAMLDDEQAWQLGAAERHAYTSALARLVPGSATADQLRQVALYYHLDHRQVQALAHTADAHHHEAWRAWVAQVLPILHHAGLAQTDDAAIDADDLAQVARAALARALPNFRYASRFSTWSRQVVVQSIQRYLRDMRALKRAARPLSLDHDARFDAPLDAAAHPETLAHARLLADLIEAVLREQPDARLALIFRLWAIDDLRVEEIGRRIRLSQPQVRSLLQRCREMLRHDPRISTWLSC